ncbi:NACHT domain-containing protein [Allokutzneria oryzae]|uniref:NACHT domain-containing protein n=1 Tax=Allokutzneria oryzae TaxID=1378989 RepID=A0ABV6A6M4_9PSEU
MRREPAITFRGALKILGHHDRPWLDRLNGVLGGAVLASGVVPPVNALWGWVDQKNEAMSLARGALDAVSDRVNGSHGLERHQLVVAAHTTMVMAAFFDVLGEQLRGAVEFTDTEKVMLTTDAWQREGESLVRLLYAADVPAPSAVHGFEENVDRVAEWAYRRLQIVFRFLSGLNENLSVARRQIGAKAVHGFVSARYRSDYLTLATTVHEFKVWSDLGEHAATRTALARLEDMLTVATPQPPARDLRATVHAINRDELDRPVIELDTDGYGVGAVFPSVADIFLTPRFRIALASSMSRPADENWWSNFKQGRDLDLVLARHFSTADSTCLPLLLLGHPGAGKSLLTKVLAARLPESAYTVVRVPLRRVDADAPVAEQIQQALSARTNGRVGWKDLADQSEDVIRVVLLDGLDELLQATTNDRGGYLKDVMEFQRTEAALGSPVAVVVTSRTLVADRVRIPLGTPMIKLEEFDDRQVHEWVTVWNRGNESTSARPMTAETALAQGDLARQPLLLLMLALYFGDPDVAPADTDLSHSELYDRLFDTYARREVTKNAGRMLREGELAEAVEAQLRRLSTAALGMFNRGRQSITEAELSADLSGLDEPSPAGGRLLGEFFFVHSAEAVTSSVQRSYEFLHATFNEHLVAARVVEELREVAEVSLRGRRYRDPDDELLFTLLSHQPLAIQAPTVTFVRERFGRLAPSEREDVVKTLTTLIGGYRQRRPAHRYPDYRPLRTDVVRPSAAYSANLVLLRVLVDSSGDVPLTDLWPDTEVEEAWRSTVNLWSAGLDSEGFRAVLFSLGNVHGSLRHPPPLFISAFDQLMAARLRGDVRTESLLRMGHSVIDDLQYYDGPESLSWLESVASFLVGMSTAVRKAPLHLPDLHESVSVETTTEIAHRAYQIFGAQGVRWTKGDCLEFLRWLMKLPVQKVPSSRSLELAESVHPGLLSDLLFRADEEGLQQEWVDLVEVAAAMDAGDHSEWHKTGRYLRRLHDYGSRDYRGLRDYAPLHDRDDS